MPIKWTPEIDQILLLKILETSNVNADVKAISAAWPENLEKPTPRAITERLVKIRATSKSSGNSSHFSVSGAKGAGSNGGTPRKRNTNGIQKSTPSKGGKANGAGKRKRNTTMNEQDASDDSEPDVMKPENDNTSDEESPSKKSKSNGRSKIKKEENGSFAESSGYENPFSEVDFA